MVSIRSVKAAASTRSAFLTKPTELHIGAPEAFDGLYKKSIQWLNAIHFYLLVNNKVYNTNNKIIAFALSYMTKESTLTWATTFRQNAISGTTITMGTFSNFITKFETMFKHHNTMGNAITWLSTKHMTKGKNNTYSLLWLDTPNSVTTDLVVSFLSPLSYQINL